MSTWRWFVVCGCTALLLSSCQPSPDDIYKQVKKSIVLIYYQNKSGQGTGFFVQEKGNKPGCNVLTAGHVVPIKNKIKLKTSDQKIWEVSDIQRFPNHDLAVINFKVHNSNKCPYEALNLGDSDSVGISHDVSITGFPGNSSVPQLNFGKVSNLSGNIDGYGISYTADTFGGMSGSPVVNTGGKVIAVHKGTQETLNVGIPINSYKENIPKVPKKPHPVLQYLPFILITVLFFLTFVVFGIKSNNEPIAIKLDSADDWYDEGNSLYNLKRYKKAIKSYDKAIVIKPDFYQAWNKRGLSLNYLKRYLEAIESYEKAIVIKPNYSFAWNNRGVSLENLKRYQEALESYDKAIKINPNNETAINNRKRLLKKIKK